MVLRYTGAWYKLCNTKLSDWNHMSKGYTQARLCEEIKRNLSQIIEFEARDPLIKTALPTIMAVKVSSDVRYAKVYIALDCPETDKEAVMKAFRHNQGFFRSALAHRMSLRYIPELSFILDETLKWAMRLEYLLRVDDSETATN